MSYKVLKKTIIISALLIQTILGVAHAGLIEVQIADSEKSSLISDTRQRG